MRIKAENRSKIAQEMSHFCIFCRAARVPINSVREYYCFLPLFSLFFNNFIKFENKLHCFTPLGAKMYLTPGGVDAKDQNR